MPTGNLLRMLTLSVLDPSPVRQGITPRDHAASKHSYTLVAEAFGLEKLPG
jgi:hypothetical protein